MNFLRKHFKVLLLLSFSCLFSLIVFFSLLELYVRTLRPGYYDATRLMEPSHSFIKKLRPNLKDLKIHSLHPEFVFTVNTDRSGFRSRTDIPEGKNHKDVIRAMFLGDSFTFGYGVEDDEAYPALVGQILRDQYHVPIETINAGFTGGYSPDTGYVFYKERARSFSPDVVVLGLCIDTDLFDLGRKNQWEMDDSGDLIRLWNPVVESPFWVIKSAAVNFLFFRTRSLMKSATVKHEAKHALQEALKDPRLTKVDEIGLQRLSFILGRFKGILERDGTRFFVVLLPSYSNFCPEEMDDRQKLECTLSTMRYERSAEVVRKAGVDSIDLLAAFQKRNSNAKNRALYYPIDRHWDRAGQQVASEEISKWLYENLLEKGIDEGSDRARFRKDD